MNALTKRPFAADVMVAVHAEEARNRPTKLEKGRSAPCHPLTSEARRLLLWPSLATGVEDVGQWLTVACPHFAHYQC
eukprot:4431771-Pyramimonas_sp.AAC.1